MAEVRRLGTPDIRAWLDLRQALWPGEARKRLQIECAEMLSDRRQAVFGLFEDTALAGFAEVRERQFGDGCKSAPVAWLEGIYIGPAHRRRRFGLQLLGAVEEWARARDLSELGSDAVISNARSIAAHTAWGFAETGRVVQFTKRL